MSILKPTDETSRLLLKQGEGKNGSKMLITARNDSLSRFTKELKQHQIPANKKVMLNLNAHGQNGLGGVSSPLSSNNHLGIPSLHSTHFKDSSRKKVNFDLPSIAQTSTEPPS